MASCGLEGGWCYVKNDQAGVPFAGSSAVMDLSGPTTLAVLSESDEASRSTPNP